jgi:hypothetical protein
MYSIAYTVRSIHMYTYVEKEGTYMYAYTCTQLKGRRMSVYKLLVGLEVIHLHL